jgi:hypothetical protein
MNRVFALGMEEGVVRPGHHTEIGGVRLIGHSVV